MRREALEIEVADKGVMHTKQRGTVMLENDSGNQFEISDVAYAPDVSLNLVSLAALTKQG